MGLFDDIADVYTGAKQVKDVAPSSQLVIQGNPTQGITQSQASSVKQAIESNKEQRERNEDRGYTPPTQDQQVAQQITQQKQKQKEDETKTDTSDDKDEEKIIDKFGRFIAFGKPIKELEDNDLKLILEQVKLYQQGMPNYFQGIPGAANFVKGFANSMSQGTERSGDFGGIKGSPTLEGLEDFIRGLDPDSNMLDSFKEADPATYLDVFGLPATDAGLDFFANLSLDDDTVDKLTQQKIIEARQRLQDAQSRQDANMGQGIMASSPAFATPASQYGMFIGKPGPFIGNFVDTDGDGVDDRFQTGPGQPRQPFVNPKAPLPGTSGTPQPVGTGITPFNVNQFYASLPQYTQQGIMSPNLSRFTDALKMFPGMA